MIAVGRGIGVLATLALVAGAGVLGVSVIRSAGIGMAQVMRANRKFSTHDAAVHFLLLPAGLLLIVPGFITDLLGLLLLLPAVRRWLVRRLQPQNMQTRTMPGQRPFIEGEAVEIEDEPDR